jgi:hypothetical protein
MIMATGENAPLDSGVYGGNPINVCRWLFLPEHLYAKALTRKGASVGRSKPSFGGSPSFNGWVDGPPSGAFPP